MIELRKGDILTSSLGYSKLTVLNVAPKYIEFRSTSGRQVCRLVDWPIYKAEKKYHLGQAITTMHHPDVYVLDPDPVTLDIRDIAWSLSTKYRWNSFTNPLISVARHLINCAMVAPRHLKFAALTHDMAEAYMGDMVRPIKQSLEEYSRLETIIFRHMAAKFGFPEVICEDIHSVDESMQYTEAKNIVKHNLWADGKYKDHCELYDIKFRNYTPGQDYIDYIHIFNALKSDYESQQREPVSTALTFKPDTGKTARDMFKVIGQGLNVQDYFLNEELNKEAVSQALEKFLEPFKPQKITFTIPENFFNNQAPKEDEEDKNDNTEIHPA